MSFQNRRLHSILLEQTKMCSKWLCSYTIYLSIHSFSSQQLCISHPTCRKLAIHVLEFQGTQNWIVQIMKKLLKCLVTLHGKILSYHAMPHPWDKLSCIQWNCLTLHTYSYMLLLATDD